MWKNKKISIVFSTYNEKNSVKKCIEELFETGVVDEIIAVNNNAEKGTDEEIQKCIQKGLNVKLVHEFRQGFGWGYRRALYEGSGDILIMIEPDGTFVPGDIFKLLAYCDDFDVVFGTRTTSIMVREGANMGFFMKIGNWAVAKIVEFLFMTTLLTDVGCTYRLIKKEVYEKIKGDFVIGGNEFNLDMMLQIIRHGIKYIEIPLNYQKRVGESSVTGSFKKTIKVGINMIILALQHKFNVIKSGRQKW
jgi:glycosyltransferase involved in cell wall biosynthesis